MLSPLQHYDRYIAKGCLVEDSEQRLALKKIQQLYNQIQNPNPKKECFLKRIFFRKQKNTFEPKGLYLFGSNGCGKSLIIKIFYKALVIRKKQYYHFQSFLLRVQEKIARSRGKKPSSPIERFVDSLFSSTLVLFLDECVLQDVVNAVLFGKIAKAFLKRGGIIVCTSNFSPEHITLKGLGGEEFRSCMDFFFQNVSVYHMKSAVDYRAIKSHDTWPYYYYPLNDKTRKMLQHKINSLTHGKLFFHKKIWVKDRNLSLLVTDNGIAFSHYKDLVLQPYGMEDFTEIAKQYCTVILDNVYGIESQDTSTVKRFILLVDAMYEKKTRLVIRAAIAPENIYVHGKIVFEFKRALSRLKEMQATHYTNRL